MRGRGAAAGREELVLAGTARKAGGETQWRQTLGELACGLAVGCGLAARMT